MTNEPTLNSDPHFWKVLLVVLVGFIVLLYIGLNAYYGK